MTPLWLRDDPRSPQWKTQSLLYICPFQTSGRRTVRAAFSPWTTASMCLTLWCIIVRAHLSVQLKMSHCALPAPFPDIRRGQFTSEKDTRLVWRTGADGSKDASDLSNAIILRTTLVCFLWDVGRLRPTFRRLNVAVCAECINKARRLEDEVICYPITETFHWNFHRVFSHEKKNRTGLLTSNVCWEVLKVWKCKMCCKPPCWSVLEQNTEAPLAWKKLEGE